MGDKKSTRKYAEVANRICKHLPRNQKTRRKAEKKGQTCIRGAGKKPSKKTPKIRKKNPILAKKRGVSNGGLKKNAGALPEKYKRKDSSKKSASAVCN